MHLLSMEILPEDIVSRPAMQFSNVDFPQPEGPTNTRKSPLSILKFISFKTLKHQIFQDFLFLNFIHFLPLN